MKTIKYLLSVAFFVSACSPILALENELSEKGKEYVEQISDYNAVYGARFGAGLVGFGLSAYLYLKKQPSESLLSAVLSFVTCAHSVHNARKNVDSAEEEKTKQYLQRSFKERFVDCAVSTAAFVGSVIALTELEQHIKNK